MKDDIPIILDYERTTFREHFTRHWQRLPRYIAKFIVGTFPILEWSTRYNLSWLIQDVIAGVTVGMVMVPQGIAYAKIANLEPQYGLYTGFVGSALYCLFGTSKDISVGPTTVVSLLVGTAVTNVTAAHPDVTGPQVAIYLSLLAGIILTLIGLARLGILIDFIPAPVIAGYMTGSAITISLGEWGNLTGIYIETHQAPYRILGSFFSQASHIQVDAAFGLVGLLALYLVRFLSTRLSTQFPRFRKPFFYFGILRSGVLVIFATLISFLINMRRTSSPFRIIETVPDGFDAVGVPQFDLDIMDQVRALLPSIILILILEHMSVAKSFARMADYTIDSNQEILAIGISNIVGSFLGAFPGTGAFSRTAIMARSGVKTPLASIFTSAIVVLALYVLTPAFYYIPEAALAAVIIHAVSDLATGPRYLKELWRTSKLEFLVFVSTVLITFFIDVETGIYVAVGLSLLVMLLQLARPSVKVLAGLPLEPNRSGGGGFVERGKHKHFAYVDEQDVHFQRYSQPLTPMGILAFRLSNALLYPNAGYVAERLVQTVKSHTCKGVGDGGQQKSSSDRSDILWNQKPASASSSATSPAEQQSLHAIVLDCAAVTRIDLTALQSLKGVRDTIDRYAGRAVEWHFCGIPNTQVRNDLILWGFGTLDEHENLEQSLVTAATTNNSQSNIEQSTEKRQNDTTSRKDTPSAFNSDKDYIKEEEGEADLRQLSTSHRSTTIVIDPLDYLPKDRYPCFHWDVDTAVRSICERRQSWQRQLSSSAS